MTNEELCLRYQAGDPTAAEELISQNMGFIRDLALRYEHEFQNPRMDADDYTQEGATALLRAAAQYDHARQVQFLSYAGQAVRYAIIDAIRANYPDVVITSLEDSSPGTTDDQNANADQFIGRINRQLPSMYETNPEYIYLRKEQLEELYAAINALSPRHHVWVVCRYGFDDDVYKSLAEMGRMYHLSEGRAKKVEEETIACLRKKMTAHLSKGKNYEIATNDC